MLAPRMSLHEPLRPTAGSHVSLIHLFSRAPHQESRFNASFNWTLHKDLRSCRQSKRLGADPWNVSAFQPCRFILKHLNRAGWAESDINLSVDLTNSSCRHCALCGGICFVCRKLLSAGIRQLAGGKPCSCLNNALSACNKSQAPVIMTPFDMEGTRGQFIWSC